MMQSKFTWSLVSLMKTRTVSLALGLVALLPICWTGATAQETRAASAQQLVAQTIANELSGGIGVYFSYLATDLEAGTSKTKEVVETPEGNLSRLIAIDGKPLTAQQQQSEESRVRSSISDLAAWRAKQKKARRDDEETNRLLKAMPQAFIYESAGVRAQGDSQIVTLTFRPNPEFVPPSRETQVFEGMKGTMEISVPAYRVVRVEGFLFQSVNFGWGILGKLNPGGHFVIEQAPIGGGRWETVHTVLRFTGKILMFKPLNIDEEETETDFRPVPALTLSQAVEVSRDRTRQLVPGGAGQWHATR
jgi:hypothetical protein